MLYTILIPMYIPIYTALIALSGVILTALIGWWNNRKQFKGLVISQSRINWIQDVRKHSAVFLSDMSNCISVLEQINSINNSISKFQGYIVVHEVPRNSPETNEVVEIEEDYPGYEEDNHSYRKEIKKLEAEIKKLSRLLIEEQNKFNENLQLLTLYLPKHPNKTFEEDEHAQLLDVMSDLHSIIKKTIEDRKYAEAAKFKNGLNDFTNKISNYLKQEWDEAKKNR